MSQLAIGIIETIGLAAAIEAADVCLKSANVTLIGYELTKGNGMTVVKVEGNVGAVKAAIEAASVAVNKVSKVYSKKVIPRPSDSIDYLIRNNNTVGYKKENIEEIVEDVVENVSEDKENIEDTIKEDEKQVITNIDNIDQEDEEIESEQNSTQEINEDSNDEEKDISQITEEEIDDNSNYTCNLCKDPKCPRVKGDLKIECIHHKERKDD